MMESSAGCINWAIWTMKKKTDICLQQNLLPLVVEKANKGAPGPIELQGQRIKELERLLEDEQLRSEAYRRMIDIAEKEYHVPIRKKPNTK